jgi:hypothetical protein
MGQTVKFVADGSVLQIDFTFTCNNPRCKEANPQVPHQEITAVFLHRDYGTLVIKLIDETVKQLDDINDVSTGVGNWYMSQNSITSDQVKFYAFCQSDCVGECECVGVKSPKATDLTAYHFLGKGEHSSCSYMAPIVSMQIPDNFAYSSYFTIGSLNNH